MKNLNSTKILRPMPGHMHNSAPETILYKYYIILPTRES